MVKKLTQSVAISRLQKKHPEIIFGTFVYRNNMTKIPCKCSICGYEWSAQYNNLVQGQGCVACKKQIIHSTDEARHILERKFPHIEFKPFTYTNQRTRIFGKCKICGSELNFGKGTSFQSMMQNRFGCRQCHVNELKKTRSLSQQEVEARLAYLHKNIIIDNFIYENQRTRIHCKCRICGYEWVPTVAQMLVVKSDGTPAHTCEKCIRTINGLNKRIDESIVMDNLVKKHPELDFSNFIYHGGHTPGIVICKECGRQFLSTYDRMFRAGSGCNYCRHLEGFDKQKIPSDVALRNLQEANSKIDFSSFHYKNCHTPGHCKCLICGFEWDTPYSSIVNGGTGCPNCNISKGERSVASILDELNIHYLSQYKFKNCKIVRHMRFDFYLPDHDTCLEIQGGQHFRPVQWFGGEKAFRKTQERDKKKKNFCLNHGINLILINYDLDTTHEGCVEIDDLPNILQNLIKH